MATNNVAVAPLPLTAIDAAVRDVYLILSERSHKLRPWFEVSERRLWTELASCILGSRVQYEVADAALLRIKRAGLLHSDARTVTAPNYRRRVLAAITSTSKRRQRSARRWKYPFAYSRATQLSQTAKCLYGTSESIKKRLLAASDSRTARRTLMELPGIGPKQASLFLRNIGFSNDVAVLDSHVVAYMSWAGLMDAYRYSTATLRGYEALEEVFVSYASTHGYSAPILDMSVWLVVRVVKQR